MSDAVYLGDAVYIEVKNGMFKLTARDGIRTLNTIYLEPEVMDNIITYVNKIYEKYRETINKGDL